MILLVPHVDISELNKNKDQNPREHLRERAGKSIKLLKEYSGGDEEVAQLSGRTFIEFLPWNREFDFQSHGLDAACADDKVLAVALRLREERPDAEVSIATDDINLELKAKSFRIAVLYLLEELKIPAELDAYRKHLQQLEKQIPGDAAIVSAASRQIHRRTSVTQPRCCRLSGNYQSEKQGGRYLRTFARF